MSWLIYTLLGVTIIMLLICIMWLSLPQFQKPTQEGMLNYFNIEDYLNTLPTTKGQFVRIWGSETNGDGRITLSQVQVIDMNGNNIALNMPVTATTTAPGSANVSITVDGVLQPRMGATNVWTSGPDLKTDCWTVDLGSVQQISHVIYSGQADDSSTVSGTTPVARQRAKGMYCEILDSNQVIVASKNFLGTGVTQTLTFPNSINITPTPTEGSVGLLNPRMMPLNSAQPEVYYVSGDYPKSEANMTCSLLGGVVATQGQLLDSYNSGADWCSPGWTTDGADAYYPIQTARAGCGSGAGVQTYDAASLSRSAQRMPMAGVNCFGVKPASGVSSTVKPFNTSGWSRYVNNPKAKFVGATSFSVPDIQALYTYVSTNRIPSVVGTLNAAITSQASSLPYDAIKNSMPDSIYNINSLDIATADTLNPRACLSNNPPCKATRPPRSFLISHGSYSGNGLYGSMSNNPLNFLYEEGVATASTIQAMKSTIQVFGTVPANAITEMNTSLDLCSKIFLGSNNDVDKFINIAYADLKPYIRPVAGWTNFCKVEVVQTVSAATADYVINLVPANQTFNQTACNMRFTTDMLGLLPSTMRDYLQIWIYNRVKRILEFKSTEATKITQADITNAGLSDSKITASASLETILNSVQKMQPTVNGARFPIDLTSNYVLDNIAQSFYEAMGGNYIMSQIYDVFPIGGTILDIRFDMTKHADISPIQAQIAAIKTKYYTIRASNVSQDILDQAKADYQTAMADLQSSQSTSTLPPVAGLVGRFFYTYSTATQAITITGFTLDARAVTSFIPELNGGLQVSTGSAAGALNYEPEIVYTKNLPETMLCSDPTTLRRIMDDYVDLTQTDLASTLYDGPAGAPSIDTSLGTIYINQIIGALQISPTQCAIKWAETLWDDVANVAIKNVTRNAVISYTINTVDWYSNALNIDASGVAFYSASSVPACKFDPVAYQQLVSPRLDGLDPVRDLAAIQSDFLVNGWDNGTTALCPNQVPNYIFNAGDYLQANPDLNARYNASGNGSIDVAGLTSHYVNFGMKEGRPVRAAQAIPPLASPIVIQQPLPANNTLDTLDGTCPETTCEDLSVLYQLVDQYNNDASQPGSIMRVTRAYTANPSQCDLEVDINYDVMAQNGEGTSVKKGSFTYNDNGAEVPCSSCPLTGVKTGTKLAFTVGTEVADCSYTVYSVDVPGSGTTIQPNTPALYKPMEYATQFQTVNAPTIAGSLNSIVSTITDAATTATSVLTSYRDNTVAAVGNIATLGASCSAKCSDTAVLNTMLGYYRTQVNRASQINTVLRVGTLNGTTCDMTFQEDTLTPGATPDTYKITTSQTAGMRFTMAPDATACTFKVTAMAPILPAGPPSVALDLTKPPSSAICNEIFGINGTYTQKQAQAKCAAYGGTLASMAQLVSAQLAGADWCSSGWLSDLSGSGYYPITTSIQGGCGNGTTGIKAYLPPSGLTGANCYGVKPKLGEYPDVLPFSGSQWSQPNACAATNLNYVNPAKEAFSNYGDPVQVSESTFPLNKASFGMDMARNRGGPGLDTLFQEPLRSVASPSEQGPQIVGGETTISPEKSTSYKYIRFRPVKTRDPKNATVDVGKFRFFVGGSEVDMRFAKVTNPMGSWVGDLQDVVGPGFRRGWSDVNKKALVFAFPYAMLINGFTWTTAHPDKGVGGDPVQWKLEGSQNGVYWTVLRDQTKHNYAVPHERFQELPVFRF